MENNKINYWQKEKENSLLKQKIVDQIKINDAQSAAEKFNILST